MNKPTKKQLEDRIAQLEAILAEKSTDSNDLTALAHKSKVTAMSKRIREDDADVKLYEVTLLVSTMVGASVSDGRGGKRDLLWETKGDVQLLTADQIEEIRESNDLFAQGVLYCPSLIPATPNVIVDFDQFLRELSSETAHTRIAEIDSQPTLFALYHHIENKRTDEKGHIVQLSPKDQSILMAVMNRLNSIMGFNFSATDVE